MGRPYYANYGGINKHVYLHVAGKLYQTLPLYSSLHTTGVYVYAQDHNIPARTARITAETQVKNEYTTPKTLSYEVVIHDLDGKAVKTIEGGKYTLAPGETRTLSANAPVSGLHFWSWGYGYLYDVYTVLKVDGKPVDVIGTRTGFRKTEFANGLFKLNDRVLHLKGYAQRTTNEWPAVGLPASPWLSDYSNRLMVEGNASLVRWMHVTPWKQDIESCDRVGLIEAMPAGDAERDAQGRQWDARVELMRDAIVYNRNNPSIIFYEAGNKGVSEEHMQQIKDLRDKFDPHGGRAAGSREMLDSKVAEYGGEMLYVNKSKSKPLWMMEYERDEGLRKYWDEYTEPFHKDTPSWNRNQDSNAIENIRRWFDYWVMRPGSGERVNAGGVKIIFSDSNTHFRGEENYRRSGAVDAMRLPKDGYFANQVMWDGWVDIERPRVHIMGHWNYGAGVKKNIYVVSSADKVELFINGQSKGYGEQSYRFLYTFKDIEFQPGEIRAVGYDAGGRRLAEAAKKTAGAPAAIRLKAQTGPGGLVASGSDLALIEVEVIDAAGNRCPTALNLINFTLSGPAEWRGGIAQGPDNYILSKSLPVENGVNRVLLRSATTPGKILVNATADGLKPASVELVSVPEKAPVPLKPYLGRGPTPAGPSYTLWRRRALHIASATAGSNSDQAEQSYDDNEVSMWSSAGDLASAWIQYELEKPAAVGTVVVRFMSFQNRSFPLRITVDGEEAFAGVTPTSFGYLTLPLKPVTGKTVKVQLTAPARDRRGNEIVELGNVRDAMATGVGIKTAATLPIAEIEFYEAPSPGGSAPSGRLTSSPSRTGR